MNAFHEALAKKAEALGFAAVAIVPVGPTPNADRYHEFIERGYFGEMDYLKRHEALKADVRQLRPWAKSMVVFLYSYFAGDLPEEVRNDPSRGIIAQYAWGPDYHDVLAAKLDAMGEWLGAQFPAGTGSRVESVGGSCDDKARSRFESVGSSCTESAVDFKPVSERTWAAEAGLGHIGRNGQLINHQWGSAVFIGELLVEQELKPMVHQTVSSCGHCRACVVACPTQAIVEDGLIDARKCIAYLTIELRGEIPEQYRKAMGNRLLGCDTCRLVCPWNSKRHTSVDPFLAAELDLAAPKLLDLVDLTEAEFTKRYGATPVARATYAGFMRNVAVALGNWGAPEAKAALQRLANHPHPLVRSHAKWGLSQI